MGIAAVAAGAGIVASGVSIANGLDSGGAGSTSVNGAGGSVPTGYQPTAQPQMDAYYQSLIAPMASYATSVPGATMGNNLTAYNNTVNNPYAGQRQSAANAAGAYGAGDLFPMEVSGARSLEGLGNTAAAYAPQILQTGFDPQSALYDRTQQQIKDQLSATNAMSGLSGTPYGAGVMGQGVTNFNIDWQNQQLQRQLQATQGYGSLASTAGRDFAGAVDLGNAAVGTQLQSGALPYSSYAGIQSDITGAGNAYAGAANNSFGLDQNTLNALSAYLKLGQSATSVGQAGQNQGFNQGQTLGANVGAGISGLSSGISGLSGLFGGGGGGVSPSNPISYGGGSYGSNADMISAYPGFDFAAAG